MTLCPESAKRAAMTDVEFWEYVYHRDQVARYDDAHEPEDEDFPELVVGFCIRCGSAIACEDYEQLRRIADEDIELCDCCADELLPDVDAMAP